MKLFEDVRATSKRICEICGSPCGGQAYCFAHLLPARFKNFQLDPNCIVMVCSIPCHEEVDKIVRGKESLVEYCLEKNIKPSIVKLRDLNRMEYDTIEEEFLALTKPNDSDKDTQTTK